MCAPSPTPPRRCPRPSRGAPQAAACPRPVKPRRRRSRGVPAGNKYRIVVWINFPYRVVHIRFIGTHKQYDEIDVQTI
ncbi:MAG: type II toxin-antitoxin system HigB family toxin [Proteobacteria bacterium]|nr:type II toxin-antitoxin system HigB family toxin [Pseudomonadota bacterium]